MIRKLIFGFIGTILLSLVGLFIGMNIGGNVDTGFEFFGGVGYEATGYLGALLGAVIGMILGVVLASSRRRSDKI